jgi:hypothetical protein
VKKSLLFTILAFVSLIFGTNSTDGATVFYANGAFTQNGIEWCEENKSLYDVLGDQFFEHHNHSIESRVCANLIEDSLWSYMGPDRVERLIERSSYFSQLEIAESQEESKVGVIDTTPADVPDRQVEDIKEESVEQKEEENEIQEINEEGGGCLIATATFGSEMSTQVQMLREIRDSQILKTQAGALFLSGFNQFYYSFSPTIADWERQSPAFKEITKITITPLLTSLSLLNHSTIDSEEEILGFGIGIILLNIGFYFGIPIFTAFTIKRNYKLSFRSWNKSEPNQTYLK